MLFTVRICAMIKMWPWHWKSLLLLRCSKNCITTSVSKYSITNFLVTKIASRDFQKRVFQLWPFWNVNILTDFMKLFRWSCHSKVEQRVFVYFTYISQFSTFKNKWRKSLIFHEEVDLKFKFPAFFNMMFWKQYLRKSR